ncbi:hypothetical protein [Arenimonas sp.]|uniref:hypothetical protein n=1 Tax=Arenimonas sp. TaxID=1872635 RepID=UPI002E33A5CD|nr:hypothetical protein [Arenimonas sp.]HEX4853972.1 hypothetical protein [Arenimonas sp.]
MSKRRARSRGIRHPARNAVVFALAALAGIALVWVGVVDMRETGRTGSPWLALGLLPALLCPIAMVHYLKHIRVFRDLRSGRSAIARWTVPADEFDRFREEQQRIPAASILANFYRPPAKTPAGGVEVIFSESGVLVGDGYFPLSTLDGRRLQSVRYVASDPPSIEFGTVLDTLVQTSSVTTGSVRTGGTLRVPVARDARQQAGVVVDRYQSLSGTAGSRR